MAQPIDKNQLAREKRDLARRARRLALTQPLDADREKLTRFAAELDAEAEVLDRRSPAISLPPAPPVDVRQQQAEQQPAAEEFQTAEGHGLVSGSHAAMSPEAK
jgi:hypothetical protein